MKVEVWFLLRSRQAKKKKISDMRSEVEFNRGIYLVSREAINFYSKKNKPKGVEIFFYEGNTDPISIDKENKDTSINYLDRFIYENVIEQTGEAPKERVKNAFSSLRSVSLGEIIKWGLVLLVGGSLVGSWLGLV